MIERENYKPDLIEYLFLIVIAYNIAPFVSRLISATITTYAYLGILLVSILFVLAKNKGAKLESYLVILIPFIIWKIYVYFATAHELTAWVYSILLDFAPVVIGIYVVNERKKKVDVFAWTIIALLVITAITSIIFLSTDSSASRILATSLDSDDETIIEYNWKNIGGYEFTYTLTLCYPILILAAKKKKINPYIAALLTVLIIVYIFYAQYTTALLLFGISSIFWFLKKDLKKTDLIIILIVAVAVIVVFYGLLTELFNWLADISGSEDMASRLRALAGGEEGLENSEDNRLELYRMSLETFLKSPLFGTVFESGGNGGHSFILDFLAQYGLVGGTVFFSIYYIFYKNLFYRFRNKSGYGYAIWIFVQTILLSTVNTGMWLYFLGIFAPVLLRFIFDGDNNENTLGS